MRPIRSIRSVLYTQEVAKPKDVRNQDVLFAKNALHFSDLSKYFLIFQTEDQYEHQITYAQRSSLMMWLLYK